MGAKDSARSHSAGLCWMDLDITDESILRAKRDYDAVIVSSQWNFKVLSQYKDHLPPLFLGAFEGLWGWAGVTAGRGEELRPLCGELIPGMGADGGGGDGRQCTKAWIRKCSGRGKRSTCIRDTL